MLESQYITNPLSRLFLYAFAYQGKIIWATTCSVLNKIFDILPEILIGIAVDTVVNRQNSFIARVGVSDQHDQLIVLGLATLVIWALESLFQYYYSIAWRTLAQSLQHNLRVDAYGHVQRLDMSYFEDKSTGALLSVLNDDVNQLERFLDGGANSFIQLITSTIAIGFVFFYLSWQVALFALVPVPIILITAYWFQRKLGDRYLDVRDKAGQIASRLTNNLGGMATIKSYAAEDYEVGRLSADSRAYQESNRKAIHVSSAFIPVVRMAIAAGFIGTTVLGGSMALNGSLGVGSYSVLIFLTQRMLWPFTTLAEMTDLLQRALASSRRVFALLDTPASISKVTKHLVKDQVGGEIELENMSFTYPNGYRVFDNLSLTVEGGKSTAFVGATGSGKTTLTKLLLRFYKPTSGRICVDHHDIENLNITDLRKGIGFIGQDVFLFHGTVRENISYGTFDAIDDEIEAAARIAEAHEFIMQLPQKYDTVVGERGQKLSGGQRQRISIARAVLKKPPILILDEATSSVDNETEIAIQRSINRISIGRTTIVIAHRLSTVRRADIIHVLDKGRVVESGTHDALVAKEGLYALLWKIQTGAGL
jgi:ATP-binding cassette subfamily B protein